MYIYYYMYNIYNTYYYIYISILLQLCPKVLLHPLSYFISLLYLQTLCDFFCLGLEDCESEAYRVT